MDCKFLELGSSELVGKASFMITITLAPLKCWEAGSLLPIRKPCLDFHTNKVVLRLEFILISTLRIAPEEIFPPLSALRLQISTSQHALNLRKALQSNSFFITFHQAEKPPGGLG